MGNVFVFMLCSDNSKIEDARAVFVAQRKKYLSVLCEFK